jgi:hypothetical protein
MNTRFPLLKTRTAFLLWAALAIVGAVPVVCFAAIVVWQLVMLFQTRSWVPMPATVLFPENLLPGHPAALWVLTRIHAALLPALVGLGIAALGVLGVLRKRAAIRAHRQENEDRLRRVQDYLRDGVMTERLDGRREPFISDRRAA